MWFRLGSIMIIANFVPLHKNWAPIGLSVGVKLEEKSLEALLQAAGPVLKIAGPVFGAATGSAVTPTFDALGLAATSMGTKVANGTPTTPGTPTNVPGTILPSGPPGTMPGPVPGLPGPALPTGYPVSGGKGIEVKGIHLWMTGLMLFSAHF
eukprot:GHVN01072705.1.p1 GENE.GHVN01072705.1~~GHVN01072705.1.p1  ORF type:complete len:152 (+),score=20.65 GHVN01072705.1:104-559(+)